MRLLAALALVAIAVFAVHAPVLRAQALTFDDAAFVTHNPLVLHPGAHSVARFFGEALQPSTVRGYYLPLSMTSLMLDVALGARPDDLRVFHRTSLVLHVVATLLLVLLLVRLFGALLPAVAIGLAFGLHPMTVEPIAWVGERKTLLAACFAFAAVLCHVEHARGGNRGWRWGAVLAYALALLAKPTVIALPIMLLVLDAWPLRRLDRRAVLAQWPLAVLALGAAAITWVSHQRTAGIDPGSALDFARWPLRAGWLLAFYLGKLAHPVDLSCAYPTPNPLRLAQPRVLAALAATLAVTAGAFALRRRAPQLLAGWVMFVVALLPTLGLVKYSWVMASDKYVYFPLLGIVLAVAGTCAPLAARMPSRTGAWRAAGWLAAIVAVAVLAAEARGVRATLRNWRDSLTLCRHMAHIAPALPAVQGQLGLELERYGAHDEAIAHLRRAIALEPAFGEAHYNLGVVLGEQGRLDEAVAQLRAAEPLLPGDPDAPYNLGVALALAGRGAEAEAALGRALALDPEHAPALDQLGGLEAARGDAAAAATLFARALRVTPDDPRLHHRLATALLMQGGHEAEAADHLREALRRAPDWPEPANALAWLLATSADPRIRAPGEAVRVAARADSLTGGHDPRVLDTEAAAAAAAGAFDRAIATERQALALAGRPRAGAAALLPGMRERLARYARRESWTEPATR